MDAAARPEQQQRSAASGSRTGLTSSRMTTRAGRGGGAGLRRASSALPNPRSEQPPAKTEEWSAWSEGPTAMAGVDAGDGVATGGRERRAQRRHEKREAQVPTRSLVSSE